MKTRAWTIHVMWTEIRIAIFYCVKKGIKFLTNAMNKIAKKKWHITMITATIKWSAVMWHEMSLCLAFGQHARTDNHIKECTRTMAAHSKIDSQCAKRLNAIESQYQILNHSGVEQIHIKIPLHFDWHIFPHRNVCIRIASKKREKKELRL